MMKYDNGDRLDNLRKKPSRREDERRGSAGDSGTQRRLADEGTSEDAQSRADAFVERLSRKKPVDAQDQVEDHKRRRLTDNERPRYGR